MPVVDASGSATVKRTCMYIRKIVNRRYTALIRDDKMLTITGHTLV